MGVLVETCGGLGGHAECQMLNAEPQMRSRKVDIRLHGKGEFKLPWRKAGLLRHLDDVVDLDQ